jgi:DNA-binding FadR family transcriptional regulator
MRKSLVIFYYVDVAGVDAKYDSRQLAMEKPRTGRAVGATRRRSAAPPRVAAKASEAIAEAIRTMIATGELAAGDALPSETVLMQTYGVARPTMREAIRILESDGLVTVKRGVGGGARIQSADVGAIARRAGLHLQIAGADFDDLKEAQDILEPGAAALAAERRTEQDLGALRLCVEQTGRATTADELARVAADFHLLILRASGNKTLRLISEMLRHLLEVEYSITVRQISERDIQRIIDETSAWFGDLVDLLESRDAVGAAEQWARHQRWASTLREATRGRPGRQPLQVFR